MLFDFEKLSAQERYKLMVSSIVPRPIAWVVTQDAEGRNNAAPFSFFNAFANEPPIVVIGVGGRGDGTEKDTATNIRLSGEFVVNLVSAENGAAMNVTAIDFPPGVDEIAEAGLSTVPSLRVKPPRIAQSPVAFECVRFTTLEIGHDRSLVLGQVLAMHIRDDAVLNAEKCYVDTPKLDLIGRMHGGGGYVHTRDIFQIPRIDVKDWVRENLMPPILRPLAVGRIAWLWGGLALSGIGDQLFLVVLGWLSARTFGDDAGLLTSVQAAVSLVTALLAGRVTDAFAHRTALIGADALRAAVLAGMVVVWLVLGDPPGWTLVAAVLALAVGNSVFRPALVGVISELAPVAMLPATNALFDTTERIARLLGPGLIGVAGAALPLVHFVSVDVLSFVASASAISLAVPRRVHEAPAHLRQGMWKTLSHGFVAMRSNRILGFTLFSSSVLNAVWMVCYFIGVPLMLVHGEVAGGIGAFGLVISAYGLTNLASTLVIGNRPMSRRPGRLLYSGNVIFGSGVLLVGLAGLLPGWLMLAGLMGGAMVSAIGGPMHDITNATLRQRVLPVGDIAAGARAYLVCGQSGLLVGLLVSPLLFREIGVAGTVILGGVAVVFVSLAGLLRFGRDEI